jgi:hypothetical protein
MITAGTLAPVPEKLESKRPQSGRDAPSIRLCGGRKLRAFRPAAT